MKHMPSYRSYTFTKRGVFYFQRRIPLKVRHLYPSDRIVLSLATTDQRTADAKARQLVGQLDAYWQQIQLQEVLKKLMPANALQSASAAKGTESSPSLNEVKELYLRINGVGRAKPFHQGVERAFSLLSSVSGNKPIGAMSRKDSNSLRDKLLS
jgi:hypothetical protein